jgi:predicted metalloprotease with PDZ domain
MKARLPLALAAIAIVSALLPSIAVGQVHYLVAPEPSHGTVRFTITVDRPGPKPHFRIPAWCPGFYWIQSYQKKISDVQASTSTGASLALERPDDRGWVVENPSGGAVTFAYRVLGDDPGLGFFGVNVRPHTAFINGPAGFMYVEGRKEEAARVKFQLPEEWDVATAMEKTPDGTYVAGDYDELIDHPIQVGKFARRQFTSLGVPFEAIFVAPENKIACDPDVEVKDLAKLCEPALKMFGGAPFKKYLFIVHLATGNFAGGLEHRSSTVLAVGNSQRLYLDTLATHEFFHVWNVKHIRPKALGPFDYTKEVRTRTLWFNEGVTDYYAQLTSYRAGFHDAEWLIGTMGSMIHAHQAGKQRLTMTVEDACKAVWEHGGFAVNDLNYYTTGAVMGLLLDAAIRDATDGARSLDDVMRLLMKRHQLPKPGFEDDGILVAINEVAGRDLTSLYQRMARTTKEFPWEVLEAIGLKAEAPTNGGRWVVRRDAYASPRAKRLLQGWLNR